MNLFNIPNPSGGHKLKAHDMNFIYDSLKMGFTALSLDRGNAILYGIAVQVFGATSINYSSGYMMIGGEIYFFQGRNINLNVFPDPVFVPKETVMSPSPRIAADSTTNNVHFQRVVEIEQAASQPIKYRLKELKHYGDPLHLVHPAGTFNEQFVFAAGVAQTGDPDYQPLSIRKVGEDLEITGACTMASFSSSAIVLTLPSTYFGSDYKPKYIRSFAIGAKTSLGSVTNETMLIDVDPSGPISVQSGTYAGSGTLHLLFNHKIPLMY